MFSDHQTALPSAASEGFSDAWISHRLAGQRTHQRLLYPALLSALGDLSGKVVLDAGCGDGEFSQLIMPPKSAKFCGVELNSDLLACAQKLLGNEAELKAGNIAQRVPWDSNSIDCIVSSQVLMHLDSTELIAALKEFARVLKPGGKIVLSVTAWEWAHSMYVPITGNENEMQAQHHMAEMQHSEYHRAPKHFLAQCNEAGFTDIACRQIVIPHEADLEERYASQASKPLFEIWTAQKAQIDLGNSLDGSLPKLRPNIIGIGGGSATGKSTLAQALVAHYGSERASIVSVDNYYLPRDQWGGLTHGQICFEAPESLDLNLLAQHLRSLKNGQSIEMPIYDFTTSTRSGTRTIYPTEIIIVEGYLSLANPEVRKAMDSSLFLQAEEETCFQRRLHRDIEERGRTQETVTDRWQTFVVPNYNKFCAPTAAFANKVLSSGTQMPIHEAIELIESVAK